MARGQANGASRLMVPAANGARSQLPFPGLNSPSSEFNRQPAWCPASGARLVVPGHLCLSVAVRLEVPYG